MPRHALDNPLVLPLLGLVIEQPAHPYELTRRLGDRYRHLDVRRSSVTTLARSLAASGLIKAQRQRRVARRPARKVYELTDAGYEFVRKRIAGDIAAARAGSKTFILAISYVGILPVDVAADALRRRLAALSAELTTARTDHSLPEYQMLEVSYWRQLLEGEIDWVETLRGRLIAGDIAWPIPASPRKEV